MKYDQLMRRIMMIMVLLGMEIMGTTMSMEVTDITNISYLWQHYNSKKKLSIRLVNIGSYQDSEH